MLNIIQFITPFKNFPQNSVPENQPVIEINTLHNKIQVSKEQGHTTFTDKINCIVEKVKEVAMFILNVGISALLYWVNPSLFAMGFIAGIVIDDQVRYAIEKIKDVWSSQKLTGTLLGGFACALSMPVTLASASILWSAHLGSLMSAEAQKILSKPA